VGLVLQQVSTCVVSTPPPWPPLVGSPVAGFKLLQLRADSSNQGLPIGKSKETKPLVCCSSAQPLLSPLTMQLLGLGWEACMGHAWLLVPGDKEMWISTLTIMSWASHISEAEPLLVVSHFGCCSCFVFPLRRQPAQGGNVCNFLLFSVATSHSRLSTPRPSRALPPPPKMSPHFTPFGNTV